MKDLKISLFQSSLYWENIDENLVMFAQKISSLKDDTDIIILPEMFSTGFSMNPRPFSEKVDGKTMQWMKKTAKEKNCILTGSLVIEDFFENENGRSFYNNRLIWQRPDGGNEFYNKKHLFRYANEQKKYTSGNKKLIVKHNGWRICPMICYDLRFPVWCRNRTLSDNSSNPDKIEFDFDILIFVANWPERRNHPWKTLLQARAMENQCYVIGVNRIGTDGNNIMYSGDSMVVNPKGEIISKTKAYEDSIETINLSWQELEDWRKTFPAWMDSDKFNLEP